MEKDVNFIHTKLNFKHSEFLVWFIFLIIITFIPSSYLEDTFSIRSGQIILFSYTIGLLWMVQMIHLLVIKKVSIIISKTDLVLLILTLILILDYYLHAPRINFSLRFIELIGLVALYIIGRQYRKLRFFSIGACLIGAFFQSIYGMLQLYGIFQSNHGEFVITGNFVNPGPYAGYILTSVCVSFGFLINKNYLQKLYNHKIIWYFTDKFLWLALSCGVLALLVSKSRAAWLGLFIAGIFILYERYSIVVCFNRWSKIYRVLFLVLSTLFLLIVALTLYNINIGSSNGRLLVWNISLENFLSHPFFGVGYDRFSTDYMSWQANYFGSFPNSSLVSSAGDVKYPFNFLLLYWMEHGVVFFFLLLCLLYKLLFLKPKNAMEVVVKSVLTANIIFSCFSYTEQVLSIKINIVCCILFLAFNEKPFRIINVNPKPFRYVKVVVFSVIVFAAVFTNKFLQKFYDASAKWSTAYQLYISNEYKASLPYFEAAYPVFKADGEYLLMYGKALYKSKNYVSSLKVLSLAKLYWDNYAVNIAIGDCYKNLKMFANAECSYKNASYMIPTRIYPKYLLVKLYLENGLKIKAITTAKDALQMNVKISNSASKEIKKDMQIILALQDLSCDQILKGIETEKKYYNPLQFN